MACCWEKTYTETSETKAVENFHCPPISLCLGWYDILCTDGKTHICVIKLAIEHRPLLKAGSLLSYKSVF